MEIPLYLEWICTAAFALSGVLSARDSNVDLDIFGVVVVGVLTALGGGTIRDILLDAEVFWLQRTDMLYWAVTVSGVGFFGLRYIKHRLDAPVLVLDAIGLAVFSVYGALKGQSMGYPWISCVMMGVITGIGGGMLRDVCSAQIPMVMRKEIYATAAFLAALCAVLVPNQYGIWLGMLSCLALRLSAIRWSLSLSARGW
ncbi:MAG: trimeric intracellular cation channel family protein [Desulfovibrionaceae bacterium]